MRVYLYLLLSGLTYNGCTRLPMRITLHKANQLGFILGHRDVITPKKPTPKMKLLVQLTVEEAKRSMPSDVIRVALASVDFVVKLPLWLDKYPLQMSYLLPVENTSFDVFSYPECSKT